MLSLTRVGRIVLCSADALQKPAVILYHRVVDGGARRNIVPREKHGAAQL